MTNTERIQAHNAELREAIEMAENLPDAGGGGTPTPTQEKTVEITENGTVSVTPDEGYALSKVTANVNVPIPEGYIKPSGTKEITDNGTHSVTEYDSVSVAVPIPDGYIQPSGTLEVTENGTKDVTAYASVSVNVPTGGGGDTSIEDGLVTRTLTGYRNERVESVGAYAFSNSAKLQSIVLPNVKTIGNYAFANCTRLTAVVFPKVAYGFGEYAFYKCTQLTTADFPGATTLYDGRHLFDGCSSLTSLILRRTQRICSHPASGGFTSTPIRSGTGYIYVPRALVDSYKSATNWSAYGDQFRALEDYTVDGTTTGALDPTKI